MRRPVTAEEKAFIVDNYDRMTAKEIAVQLNRSINTVHWYLRHFGYAKPRTTASDSKPPTDREVAFIRAHARTWPLDRIAFELKRLPAFVVAVCEQEGIA